MVRIAFSGWSLEYPLIAALNASMDTTPFNPHDSNSVSVASLTLISGRVVVFILETGAAGIEKIKRREINLMNKYIS